MSESSDRYCWQRVKTVLNRDFTAISPIRGAIGYPAKEVIGRISKARQMMQDKIPIVDTAMSSGFYDQSHLNRIFKKICGITPGQYVGALQ